ncbi:hypothetical protein ABIB40_002020 [Pedobacter sp. UYP30]|uniref:hypothetical protein n=1 Tax=Pedobacter sp. UYP30 TaxID=1756400 RepID=UPI00339B00FA
MENINPEHIEGQEPSKPIETSYEDHKADPGPGKPAITEKDKNGASKAMMWVIPILVIALLVYWFLMRK